MQRSKKMHQRRSVLLRAMRTAAMCYNLLLLWKGMAGVPACGDGVFWVFRRAAAVHTLYKHGSARVWAALHMVTSLHCI